MYIDIEKAQKEFMKYINKYNIKDENIDRKVWHSIRVMENSKIIVTMFHKKLLLCFYYITLKTKSRKNKKTNVSTDYD